jgi:hypothetical protein
MFIKAIVIEGVEGDVEIARTDAGALVTVGNTIVCEVRRDEGREARFAKATLAARHICGTDRKGDVCATNSMLHEVWNEIDRVAGC